MSSDSKLELRAATGAFAVAVVLTAVFAWPVLVNPTERIPGREIVGRHLDAYNFIGQLEQPIVVRYDRQPATDWPANVLAAFVGEVVAFNVTVLATFPLTALTAFLLGRYLGLGFASALFAALLFAFSPFHVAHAAYHPHIVQLQWIPLYLLALWRVMDRWSIGWAVLLVASALLMLLANFYHFLVALLVTPVAFVAYWWVGPRRGGTLPARSPLLAAGTLGSVALLGLGYVALFAPRFFRGWGRWAADYEDLFVYSARWWSYLVPSVDHWLLGGLAERFWRDHPLEQGMVEHQLYAGFGVLVLAAIALGVWWRGERTDMAVRSVPVLGVVALAAFVSSLPPVVALGPLELPAPSALLYPLVTIFRAYARNGVVALLMLALLAAIGLRWLLGRSDRSRRIGFALLAVVVVEMAPVPPWRWHDVLPTTAHRWLAEQPGPMRIMDCAEPSFGALSVTDLMPHPTAVLGVFSRRAIHWRRARRVWTDPEMWDPVRPLSDCAEPELAPKLAALGYSHLLVRADYRLRDLVPRDGLVLLRRFDDADVFSVEAPKAAVFMGKIEGLSWRSGTAARSFRWVGERGRFEVINGGRSAVRAVLEIELFAFHRPRPTDVFLDGAELASAVVTPEPERFVWGPVELPPGVSRLELVPRGDPLVPAEILGTEDTRAITIGVGEWEWGVLERADPSADGD